jgi:PKD domain.
MGCTNSYSLNLQMAPIGIDYKAIDCDKHIYQFDAIVLDPSVTYTYLWDFGGGVTDTNKTTSHTFAAAGNYNVQLTISSSICTITFKQSIVVEGPPALKLDREPVFCKGDSMVVHVSGASTYIWNNSTVGDSILINHVGDYNVIGTSKSGCTGILTFKATNYDLDNYTIQTNRGEVSVENPTLKLWSESIPSSNYYWDFGDGNTAQGSSQEHVFSITNEKYFDVKLKVINPNGCEEYATKKIYVKNSALYNTFTPNGDGIDDVFMKGWRMKVYNRNGILLYDGIDGWDGTYKGKQASNGTYFYILYYNTESGIKTSSGYVTVVR